jgi:hypothetical protein
MRGPLSGQHCDDQATEAGASELHPVAVSEQPVENRAGACDAVDEIEIPEVGRDQVDAGRAQVVDLGPGGGPQHAVCPEQHRASSG